ncbi:hypothetical protein HN803_02480 [candidate division WWE3 bacterium]|jgi:hypothetical protein|nr:hypothetical protein [Candidatus Scalindua sp.]MBT7349638.1 hypothetical protein [candidate division WWE3 bacterium]
MEDNEKEREVEFSNFINCCADTIHYALSISDDKWADASELELHNEIVDLVNGVVMSVIGNKNLKEINFQKVDYDLMFVATLRKALSLATGIEEL